MRDEGRRTASEESRRQVLEIVRDVLNAADNLHDIRQALENELVALGAEKVPGA